MVMAVESRYFSSFSVSFKTKSNSFHDYYLVLYEFFMLMRYNKSKKRLNRTKSLQHTKVNVLLDKCLYPLLASNNEERETKKK